MLPHPFDTQELLDQARQGHAAAVDRLLAIHREPLRRMIALRLDPALAGRLDASDVVQEVLLEASRRLKDYLHDPAMPFALWLRHLARDHIIDAHRRHRKAQRRSLDREQSLVAPRFADQSSAELIAQFLDRELTPASAAIQEEMRRRLEAAIASLEENDREVILMKLQENLSNQEIAAILGLSEPAASMRYLRAVRRLRAILFSDQSHPSEGP
jgi:RNA polymerase sigma-70 factor (ECF subfamily)